MWGTVETSVKAVNAEYETEIHFQKCYGVMTELFEAHDNLDALLPRSGFRFLDLGCAPGGFSSFLLEDPRCEMGFGVSLPSSSGGFPVRVRSRNFFLQQGDLFEIGPTDLLASEVHVCVCDAQYLRNNISWDEKYRGVRCRSKQHGVWSLLLKQFWLGLSRLLAGGVLIFRFGWRDPGPDDPATVWYKKMTLRLFSLLIDLFGQVREVKSDYFNALQSSFYVCCSNFRRDRYVKREVAKLLGVTFNYLLSTSIEDSNELDILPQADRLRTEEVDKRISDMLDRIQKIRLVHEQSRKWHQQREVTQEDPRAVAVVAPAPPLMSDDDIAAMLAVYGRVLRIDREACQVSIQFAMLEHALSAVSTLRSSGALGDGIGIWLRGEETAAPPAAGDHQAAVSPPGFAPQPSAARGRSGGRREAPGPRVRHSEAPDPAPPTAAPKPPKQAGQAAAPPQPPEQAAAQAPAAKAQSGGGRPAEAVGNASACKQGLHPVLQDKQARTKELIAELLKSK